MIDAAQFLVDFPEFNNATTYPPSRITWWLNVAYQVNSAWRFGNMLDSAVELYVAHKMYLVGQAVTAAARGAAPGQMTGPLSAKAVDKVSAAYDTGAATIDGEGDFNLSTYGVQYVELRNLFGAGGLQL